MMPRPITPTRAIGNTILGFHADEETRTAMHGTTMRALCFILASCIPLGGLAQAWPAKPVRMLVPFAPGGGVDFAARIVSRRLSERLGQQVVVENRAGANGIIALEVLKNAAADGYTLAAASNGPLVINPSM